MTKLYIKGRTIKAWPKLALLGLLGLAAGNSYGQVSSLRNSNPKDPITSPHVLGTSSDQRKVNAINYPASRGVNVAGTYTDLGTNGKLIITPNLDDANSEVQEIGFPFSYNGAEYTQFVLNTNGMIRLGDKGLTNPANVSSLVSTDLNIIAPASGIDLTGATDQAANPTTYRVNTTGTAGNRICTIQFKNLTDKPATGGAAAQFATMQFQIKLYEANSNIEFVYGAWTATANAPIGRGFLIGIKGSGNTYGDLSMAYKASSLDEWSKTIFQTVVVSQAGQASLAPHFVRNSVLPDPGRTYRFRKAPVKDIAVQTIYSLGKLPIPYGVPHVVQAFIENGSVSDQANVTVTLKVTGANTFTSTKTVAALGVGKAETISFDPFTPTNPGTNTITVSVADDDDNENNISTFTQLVNENTFAYAQPGVEPDNSIGFGAGTGILGNKYTTNAARTITGVTVRLGDGNALVGNKVYGVVLDENGSIISRSPEYTVLAADLDKDKTFVVNAYVPTGSFIVGLAQTVGKAAYFPVATQSYETPTRLGAYYATSLDGGEPEDVAAGADFGAFMIEAIIGAAPSCPPPTGITISKVGPNSAVLTFTGPTNGTSYTVIYGPRGFDPTVSGTTLTVTGSPFTLDKLVPLTGYDLYIQATCTASDKSALVGPKSFTTLCQPPIIATFPYVENFDGIDAGTLRCGVTVDDVNNDNATWEVVAGTLALPAASPSNHMRYSYSEKNAANDWFYTPALALKAGYTYQLTFKYRSRAKPEGLEVKYGTAATPAEQTNLLWSNTAITNMQYATAAAGNKEGEVKAITPTATGNYYIGFHAISTANQYELFVDDITVTATAITGTSAALQRAINLYPNPTEGNLTVKVSGANAKNGLQVEVTNMLGQRVHTETVRDNAVQTINLSKLANGMYTVKVRNGAEYMVRTISVQK
ncbi:T9SS-dependent choice-of-anchor J family protein [Hymenobacter aerophilus]|uniref:T9SS-dependent choice-of-anchor J family protein n=1 Tax=Hymenobacter aerophilus TaxID=119644 RepID=UPI0009FC09FA|nr:T9SS type A sorting domain-containing protein [Hymenobacter aerophilus]